MLPVLKRHRIRKRLEASLKPDLDYARRCAAQLPEPRKTRFMRNVGLV